VALSGALRWVRYQGGGLPTGAALRLRRADLLPVKAAQQTLWRLAGLCLAVRLGAWLVGPTLPLVITLAAVISVLAVILSRTGWLR